MEQLVLRNVDLNVISLREKERENSFASPSTGSFSWLLHFLYLFRLCSGPCWFRKKKHTTLSLTVLFQALHVEVGRQT